MVQPAPRATIGTGFGLGYQFAKQLIESDSWLRSQAIPSTTSFMAQMGRKFGDGHIGRIDEANDPVGYSIDDINEYAKRGESFDLNIEPVEYANRLTEQYLNLDKWGSVFGDSIEIKNNPISQIYEYPSSWENSNNPKKYNAWIQNEQLIKEARENELQVLEEIPAIGKDSYQSRIYGTQELVATRDTIGPVNAQEYLNTVDNTTLDITGLNFKDIKGLDKKDHSVHWSQDNWKDIIYNLASGSSKMMAAIPLTPIDPVALVETLKENYKRAQEEINTAEQAHKSGFFAPPDSLTRTKEGYNPVVDFVKSLAENAVQSKNPMNILEGAGEFFDEGLAQIGRPLQQRIYMDQPRKSMFGDDIGIEDIPTMAKNPNMAVGALALSLFRDNKSLLYYDAIVKDQKEKGTYKKGWVAEDNRLDQAAQMAIDNGDIPWPKQIGAEVLTDPIELIPTIGIYGGITKGAIRGGRTTVKALRPRAITFDALKNELRLPKINTLGLSKPNISFKSLLNTDINTKIEMKRMIPTLKNIFTRNPTIDKNLISEPRVNLQNILENNLGLAHEESDALINLTGNAALRAGKSPADVFSKTNHEIFEGKSFNYVNDLFIPDNTLYKFGNESIETTTRNSNLLIEKGHPVFQSNLSVAFDLIDEVDQINRIRVDKNAINIKEGGLNLIGRNGLFTSEGVRKSKEFERIGLTLSNDELASTGIIRWLEDKLAQGTRTVSLDELRRYEEDSRGILIANNAPDLYGGLGIYSYATTPGLVVANEVTTLQFITRNIVELSDDLGYFLKEESEHYKDIRDNRVVVSNLSNLLPNSKGLNWKSIFKANENIAIHERGNIRWFLDLEDGLIKLGSMTDEFQSDYFSKLNRGGRAHSFTNLWKSLTTGLDSELVPWRLSQGTRPSYAREISETAQKAIYNIPEQISKRTNENSVWASKHSVDEFKNQFPNDPRLEAITRGNGYTGRKRFVHMTPFNKTISIAGYKTERYIVAGLDEIGETFVDLTFNDAIKPFQRLFTEDNELLNLIKTKETRNIINEKVFSINPEQFVKLVFRDTSIFDTSTGKAPIEVNLKTVINNNVIEEFNRIFNAIKQQTNTELLYVHIKHLVQDTHPIVELDIGTNIPSKYFKGKPKIVSDSEQIINFIPSSMFPWSPTNISKGTNLSFRKLLDKFEYMVKDEMFTEVLGKTDNYPKSSNFEEAEFISESYTKVTDEPTKTSYDPQFIIFSKAQIRDGLAPIRIKKFPEGWSITENTFTPEKLAKKDPAFTYRDEEKDAIDDAFIFLNSHRNDTEPLYMIDSMFAEKHFNIMAGYILQKASLQRNPFHIINTSEVLKHRYYDVTTPYSLYGENGKIMKAFLDHAKGMLGQVGYKVQNKSLKPLIKKVKMLTPENPSQYAEDASSYYDTSVTPFKRIDKADTELDRFGEYTDKQLAEFDKNPNIRKGIGAEEYTNNFMPDVKIALWDIVGNEKLTKVLSQFEFGDESNRLGEEFLNKLSQLDAQMEPIIQDPNLRVKYPEIVEESDKISSIEKYFDNIIQQLSGVAKDADGNPIINQTFTIKEAIEHFGIPTQITKSFSPAKFVANKAETGNLGNTFSNNSVDDLITYIAEKSLEIIDPTNAKDITGYNRLTLKPRELEGMPGFEVPGIDLNANVENLFGVATDLNGKPLENAPKTLGEIYRHNQIRLYKARPETNTNGNILGYTDFSKDGETIIKILRAGDFNTVVHEYGHVIRRTLLNERDLETIGRTIMGDNNWDALPNKNVWTVEAEEMFANQLEIYIRTGQAKRGLARIFDRIIDYLKTFYRSIRNTTVEKELNPELKKFFDEFIDIGRPTREKIIASLPTHEQADVLKFFGYDGGSIPTPILPSAIKGVALHDQARYAEQQAETILFKTEDDHFTGLRNSMKSQEQAINELPWDQYKQWEVENLDETEIGLEQLPDLQDMEQIINANFIVDSWEVLARTPVIKELTNLFNPSAGARNPLFKSIVSLFRMKEQSKSLTTNAISRLDRLGSSQKVFGKFDDTGRIADGPLKGFNVNDIRSRPLDPRWRNLLTDNQRVWIRTAESLERAKLAMLKAEGIEIRTLSESEGGGTVYAGRRTFAQISSDGEVLDLINMGTSSRPGAKAAFEKARKFETMEEAIENGYRYIPDEEALRINIEAAYNRVAYQRHMQYILDNVVTTRTGAAPEKLRFARDVASERLSRVKALLKQLHQTKRGENIHPSTLRSLKNAFPELGGRLDTISKLTLQDLIEAGKKARNQPISMKPKKETIRKIFNERLKLETQIKALDEQGLEVPPDLINELNKQKRKHWWHNMAFEKAWESYRAGNGFIYTFELSAKSILMEPRVGLIDELIDIVQGTTIPGTRRKRGGILQDLNKKAAETQQAFTKAKEEATQLQRGEGIFRDAPAYTGRIFTKDQPVSLGGMNGQDVSNMLTRQIIGKTEGYEGAFANVLKATRVFNAATRFFTLGADASPFLIHLIFLWGESATNPKLMANVMKGFVSALFSPTYHAKLIDDNAELLAKYPDVLVGSGGRFETTEYFNMIKQSGLNKYKPFRIGRKIIEAPYIPAQRAFESVIDSAGIQLLKMFDHLGVDAKSIREISDFTNNIRGVSSTKRIGVSSNQKQWEQQLMLAPSYNRAIAALLSDLVKPSKNMRDFTPGISTNGDLRIQLTRRALNRGITAIALLVVAANMAQDMSFEDIVEQRLNPNSPGFLGVNIGGTEIAIGSKVVSIIKFSTRMAVATYEGNSEEFIPQSMSELGAPLQFIRGNLSFGAQSATTILTGRTYMGDRIYHEGIWDTAKAFGKHVFPGPFSGPIWAQSVMFEGGSVTDKGTRGVVESVGGRAYPEGSYQILREFTKNNLDMDYADLEPFEKRIIRTLLEPQLTPLQMERIEQGDNTAGYWAAVEDLDAIRFAQEESILLKYQQRTGKYAEGGISALRQDFYAIQENYAQHKALLNQQYDMFQDDVEYDEDSSEQFVMSQWYALYEKATDPQTGLLNYDKLQALQGKFWNETLPNGDSYRNYFAYIRRNISSTIHPEEFARVLSPETVQTMNLSAEARIDLLNSRPGWAQAFDKYGYKLEDFSIWK